MILQKFHKLKNLINKNFLNLKYKKYSSQQWIARQLKDPYVEMSKQENYRCRSAFKLLEINNKFNILQPGFHVIDCGAAPGSWTQIATKLTNADGKILNKRKGTVFAIDILPIHDIKGATIFGNLDFSTDETQKILKQCLQTKYINVVMSDMAPNSTGIKDLDHENIVKLVYLAFKFAIQMSTYNGTFIAKVWDGPLTFDLEQDIAKFYKNIKIIKPLASRLESSEKFIVALGFKGIKLFPNYKNC